MSEKYYKNIKEVSKILNIKEHVIRYWDSVDPKTNRIRFNGLSTRSRGGTRYFNKENINKLRQLNSLLFENGKHNYSLDLANKILSSKKSKVSDFSNFNITHNKILDKKIDIKLKLDKVLIKLQNLIKL